MVKNLPAMQETWVQFLGQEDPLQKGMATHSSILAWRIPWTKEHGRLQIHELAELDSTEQFHFHLQKVKGFLGSACEKESACQCRTCKRHRLDLWVGKIPSRTAWKPTPVFLLENGNPLQFWASHGQSSLVSHSPQDHKESDTTEVM